MCAVSVFGERKVPSSWNLVSPIRHPHRAVRAVEMLKRSLFPHMVPGPLWRGEPAAEQEAIGFVVPDEEKEGVVCTERWNNGGAASLNYD